MTIIIDMHDDLAARGVRLAMLRSVVRMAQIGMKTRGVTPSKAAKMLGYTGPANLAKILAWTDAEAEAVKVAMAERMLAVQD